MCGLKMRVDLRVATYVRDLFTYVLDGFDSAEYLGLKR